MATAAAVDTDSTSCGFCLQRVAYMEDPRELDCGHVYCMPCLVGDYTTMGVSECVICGKSYSKENVLDTLKKYEAKVLLLAAVEVQPIICSLCTEKMVIFCLECEVKLCDSHAEYHNTSQKMFSKRQHPTVGIDSYRTIPKKFEQRFCSEHTDCHITEACEYCYAILCKNCDKTACGKGPWHSLVNILELSGVINERYEKLLRQTSERVTELSLTDKRAWGRLEDKEAEIKEKLAEVDMLAEKQISEIRNDADRVKSTIKEALTKETQKFVTYVSKLTDEREQLNELWTDTKRHLSNLHDADIITEFADREQIMVKRIEKKQKDDFDLINVKVKERGRYELDALITARIPLTLTYKAGHSGAANSVCWISSGIIVYGTSSLLGLLDENMKQLPSSFTGIINANGLTSVNHGETVLGLSQGSTNSILSFDSQLKRIGVPTQLEYPNSSSNGDYVHMTVAGDVIIALDPVKKQLRRYNIDGGELSPISLTSMTKPRGVASLNTSVVVADHCERGSVQNYCLDASVKLPVWTCKGIKLPTGISVDEGRELIFTAGMSNLTVYVVSKQGEKLAELKMSGGCKAVYDVSVNEDKLAVADKSKGVQLYEIEF